MRLRFLLSGFLLVGLVAATGAAQDKVSTMPDAEVEANVLKALASSPQLADQNIRTTTVYGQVTLSGTVRDEASRDMAEELASNAPGVKKVVDQLAIGTPTTADNNSTNPSDQAQNSDQAPNSNEQGTNPTLQSDGTYAPAPNAEGQGNPPEDQDVDNQTAQQAGGPPPPPQPPSPRQPYGSFSPQARRPYVEQQGGESVVVPSGALLRVRVNQGMDSKHTAPGTTFDGVVLNDVVAGNMVAIPRGTAIQGQVVDAQTAGAIKGKGELALQLTQITLGGQTYSLASDVWTHEGASKTGQTVGSAVGLGAVGAMIGAVAGGGPGAILGAGLGGVAGIGTSAASGGGQAMIPAEAILTFHLTQELPVTTVSQAEMNRLASAARIEGRQLRRRYPPPPPPPYYYGPYYPYYY
ncbi:MAG TPA: BON domain-containing protein [Edaphobacter sp.]|nr:BON domain-containing protein [Edaphobacter sp.]